MKTCYWVVRDSAFTCGLRYLNEISAREGFSVGEHLVIGHQDRMITLTIGSVRRGSKDLFLFGFQQYQLGMAPGDSVEVERAGITREAERVTFGVRSAPDEVADFEHLVEKLRKAVTRLPVIRSEVKKICVKTEKTIRSILVTVLDTDSPAPLLIGEGTGITFEKIQSSTGSGQQVYANEVKGERIAEIMNQLILEPKTEREFLLRVVLPVVNPEFARKSGLAGRSGVSRWGERGKRMCMPNAWGMIHQPLGGGQGQASDVEIQAKEINRVKQRLNEILVEHTSQPMDVIKRDTDRDFFLTAKEATEYGLVDKVIKRRSE